MGSFDPMGAAPQMPEYMYVNINFLFVLAYSRNVGVQNRKEKVITDHVS